MDLGCIPRCCGRATSVWLSIIFLAPCPLMDWWMTRVRVWRDGTDSHKATVRCSTQHLRMQESDIVLALRLECRYGVAACSGCSRSLRLRFKRAQSSSLQLALRLCDASKSGT